MDASAQPALRPLNIGEIFDRAVTLYVRNFALFTLIMLTIFVPFGVLQYIVTPDKNGSLQQQIAAIEAPLAVHRAQTPVSPYGSYTPAQLLALICVVLLVLLIIPFATNAIAVGVAALYTGRVPKFDACFAAVFRRWLPIFGLLGSWFLIGLVAYMALIMALFVLVAIGVALAQLGALVAVIEGIIGVIALVAVLLIAAMMALAATFSFYTLVIEQQRIFQAIGFGFVRIFNHEEFWKALLIALAYFAIQIGAALITAVVALLILGLTKMTAVELGVSTICNALLSSFSAVLIAVYYYDVRIRREGFDLEADVQRLTT